MAPQTKNTKIVGKKTAILVTWKQENNRIEAFTSLKHFTRHFPAYNIETLRYHTTRKSQPFENEVLRIERVVFHEK